MPLIQGSNFGMALMNLSKRQSSPGSILIVTLECSFCPLVVLVLLRDQKATQAEGRITIINFSVMLRQCSRLRVLVRLSASVGFVVEGKVPRSNICPVFDKGWGDWGALRRPGVS